MSELNTFLAGKSRQQKLLRKSLLKFAALSLASQLSEFVKQRGQIERDSAANTPGPSHQEKAEIGFYGSTLSAYNDQFEAIVWTIGNEILDELNIDEHRSFGIDNGEHTYQSIMGKIRETIQLFTDYAEKLNVPAFDLSPDKHESNVNMLKAEVAKLAEEVVKALELANQQITNRRNEPGRMGRLVGDLMVESGMFRDAYKPLKQRVNELRDKIIVEASIPKESIDYRAFDITTAENNPPLVEQNITSAINELKRLSDQLK